VRTGEPLLGRPFQTQRTQRSRRRPARTGRWCRAEQAAALEREAIQRAPSTPAERPVRGAERHIRTLASHGDASVRTAHPAAPALDEIQSCAGARSAPASRLHLWKSASAAESAGIHPSHERRGAGGHWAWRVRPGCLGRFTKDCVRHGRRPGADKTQRLAGVEPHAETAGLSVARPEFGAAASASMRVWSRRGTPGTAL
jgi:hypothetical protein